MIDSAIDMLHVPNLSDTLLSVSKAVQPNRSFLFTATGCTLLDYIPIIDLNRSLATGRIENGIYRLNRMQHHESVKSSRIVPNCPLELWHRRLGHRNYTDLLHLSNHQIARGISLKGEFKSRNCPDCAISKAKKQSFPQHRDLAGRSYTLPTLLHSDICGPLPTTSLGGAKYFVTYIKDISRMKFTFLLKHKSEQAKYFHQVQAYCERQTGRKVKILRADNGGEFTSHAFRDELSRQGIEFQSSVANCSSQNGVAERSHLTIMDMVRAMLGHAHLGKEFCVIRKSTIESSQDVSQAA
jgi:hypothetical protein